MHTLFNLVSGPLAVLSFLIFIGGCVYRVSKLVKTAHSRERFIFSYMSLKYGLRSILHWMTPFGTTNMKLHPWMTAVTFLFHICLFLVPIFLLSHIILWNEAWGLKWMALPDGLADFLTLVVIGACIFFLVRRHRLPEVRYLTSVSDYVILAIVAAPFITGFIAYHQLFAYRLFHILHIFSGEVMLAAIPFTRLSHMVFAPFTRAYMGSEFGGVRHARDW